MTTTTNASNADLSLSNVGLCATCIFWVPMQRNDKGQPVIGECRRNPPTVFIVNGPPNALGQSSPQVTAQFPPTMAGIYCGEHDDGEDESGPAN